MANDVDSRGGSEVAAAQAGPAAFAFFAASARNYIPRLVSSFAMATMFGVYVGWQWALPWVASIAFSLFLSARLVTIMQQAATPEAAKRVWRLSTATSVFFTGVQCVPIACLWLTGNPAAEAFAIMGIMIGATYVMMQYYAELTQFRLFLAPYIVTLLGIGAKVAWDSGFSVPALIAVGASTLTLVNFLHFSRQLLDRSRTALRKARAQAQENATAAQSANAAKSAFLATMSHEIRTPLNGVLGMAQAMAADDLAERQRDRLSVIHQSGESLLAILNDLLDLSKIEAGKLELESIEFDLGDVARGAHSAFTALANKKGLSFCLDIEAARGRYQGDPTRLRQILYNLISNALKFTEQGEIRVLGALDGETLVLSVRDTGVGISPENLHRLFAKFDQLDSSTTRRFGGTGLGLSICRELANLMDGDISVESVLGEGSTFTLRVALPRIGDAKPPAQLAPVAPVEMDMRETPLRVLAAEDNAVNQLVLKTLLHQLGVEPTLVDNGQAAVEAWESATWDAILMDIQMPLMDGITATRLIREAEARTGRARTPIVALTANAMSHQVEQYLATGMDCHVAKPIEAAALFTALLTVTADPPGAAEADDDQAVVA